MGKLSDKQIKVLERMKELGMEQDLIVGTVLICGKNHCDCEDEVYDFLMNKSDDDDQDLLNLIAEIAQR